MEVNEGLQESPVEQISDQTQSPAAAPTPEMTVRGWLRLAYMLEFLIAILAVFTLWGEVGGEGHLDLLPWYIKLVGVLGMACCCVRFTAAIVEHTNAWNRRSIGWLLGICFLAIAMAGITYYYHLNEEPSDDSSDTTASVNVSPRLDYISASTRS